MVWHNTRQAIALGNDDCSFDTSRVSCQKGPTRHAYAWQIGPFWQDTLELYATCPERFNVTSPLWWINSILPIAAWCQFNFNHHCLTPIEIAPIINIHPGWHNIRMELVADKVSTNFQCLGIYEFILFLLQLHIYIYIYIYIYMCVCVCIYTSWYIWNLFY